MITCPSCGSETSVLDTRTEGTGPEMYTRRRRGCDSCDRRFTTTEVIVPDRQSSDVMMVPTRTMEQMLRLFVSAFSARSDCETDAKTLVARLLEKPRSHDQG